MKNKEITKSISFFVILNLVIISAWFFLFTSINKKKDRVELLQNDVAKRVSRQNELSQLKLLVDDVREEKNKLATVFINENNIVDFIESLEGIAEASKVDLRLRSVNVASGKAKNTITQFNINGEFENVFHYIALLETAPYQILFNKVSFVNKEDNNFQVDLNVTLTSFYEKD